MYYNNLDHLFNNKSFWIYGHSNFNMDNMIDKCRVISNQLGKNNNYADNYKKYKVIEI